MARSRETERANFDRAVEVMPDDCVVPYIISGHTSPVAARSQPTPRGRVEATRVPRGTLRFALRGLKQGS